MILLTFLGTGNYASTKYYWKDQEKEARFAPAASQYFLRAKEVRVFLTEDSKPQFSELCQELPKNVDVQSVSVPLGKDEDELWQIFTQVSTHVQHGEQIAFDITHGLRSFPLIGLLVSAFLKSGFRIDLQAVLYGAYDVGRAQSPGRTPMFDLTPMLSLLEWSAAADRFNRTGDSRYFASLVRDQRKALANAAQNNPIMLEQVGRLANLAGALSEISHALYLIRPYAAMKSVAELSDRVKKAQDALARSPAAQPFQMLLNTIVDAYAPLAQPEPENPEQLYRTLHIERIMIGWYIDRELWVQAVSLAREWLLSWVMVQYGNKNITQLNARQIIENMLGSESNGFVSAKKRGDNFRPAFLENIPCIQDVLSLWPNLTEVRNDIDHAGKREDPGTPKELTEKIRKIYCELQNLPLEIFSP